MTKDLVRILLIDKDNGDYQSLSALLSSQRFTLNLAEGFEMGLRLLAENKHDACLVNYDLNNKTGLELIKEAIENGCKIPLILLSDSLSPETEEELISAGAADYLERSLIGLGTLLRNQASCRRSREGGNPAASNNLHIEELDSRLRGNDGRGDFFRKSLASAGSVLTRTILFAIERGRKLQALQRSENKYRSIAEKSLDGIAVARGVELTYANDELAKFLGFKSKEEMLGRSFLDFVVPGSRAELLDRGERRRRGEDVPERYEITLLGTDGREIPGEVTVSLFDDEGHPASCGVFRDMTERRQEEETLRQAQKMQALATLAGGIAHDFNNILYVIIGLADLAYEEVPKRNKISKYLKEILVAGRRATDLVNQILTFSRQQDEQGRQPVHIQSIVKESLRLLRGPLPKTIEIRKRIDMKCSPVLAEPVQIHQVIMNLCANAYQAMLGTGGVLDVELGEAFFDGDDAMLFEVQSGKYVVLSVSDSGKGMDEATMSRIFEPYFTTKGTGQGTGLGLSMVHGIVKGCGGGIAVSSTLGKGSNFKVLFPAGDESHSPVTFESAVLPVFGNHERVLLVDDERQVVFLAKEGLERAGFHVRGFTNSRDALEAFRQTPAQFDIVLTDQTMPNLTGAELATEIHSISPGFPVILCTGFSDIISEEQAHKQGIRDYLRKPVTTRMLSQAIRRVLDSPPQADPNRPSERENRGKI